jgi:hypothetical protein
MMPVEAGNNSLKELFSIPQATSYVAESGFSKLGAPAVPVYACGGICWSVAQDYSKPVCKPLIIN